MQLPSDWLTAAVADEPAIRHTAWHPQWAEAAIFIAGLIVDAIGKLEEILWLVFDINRTAVMSMSYKQIVL